MKVLSLFDGMACGMLALQKAEIEVDRYVAYEIDKYAVQTATHNFPMIEQRGDVFAADFSEFNGFDFLIGGSPCTYWSIAQKNNRETEASGMGWELFSQYVRALHEAKPKFFVYENNKSMSKAIRASIDEAFGFEAICINSSLVSAQNRQRLYWVGKRNDDGTYSKVPVEQPEDLGVLLKDVLESGCAYRDKSTALAANRGGISPANDIGGSRHTLVAEPVRVPEYGMEDKSRPVTACYAHKGCGEGSLATEAFPDNPNKQVRDYVAEPVRVGSLPRPNGKLSTSQAFRVYSIDGKAVNLTAQGGGAGAKTGLYAIPVEFNGEVPVKAISATDGKTYTIYEVKDGQITIKGKQHPIKLIDGYYIIRKLMVKECMRLQTVPEWYEFPVSDSQAYKMLGNGWTVNVIAHLFRACRKADK